MYEPGPSVTAPGIIPDLNIARLRLRAPASDDTDTILQFRDFPETLPPGCHDSWRVTHFVSHDHHSTHTWQCTGAVSCHLRSPDDGTICVCFTLWVFSLGFMMSFSKAESQCENICHPERAARLALALFVSTWRLMLKLISKYDILQSSKLKKQVIFGSENYRRLNCFNADRLRLI